MRGDEEKLFFNTASPCYGDETPLEDKNCEHQCEGRGMLQDVLFVCVILGCWWFDEILTRRIGMEKVGGDRAY